MLSSCIVRGLGLRLKEKIELLGYAQWLTGHGRIDSTVPVIRPMQWSVAELDHEQRGPGHYDVECKKRRTY